MGVGLGAGFGLVVRFLDSMGRAVDIERRAWNDGLGGAGWGAGFGLVVRFLDCWRIEGTVVNVRHVCWHWERRARVGSFENMAVLVGGVDMKTRRCWNDLDRVRAYDDVQRNACSLQRP